MASMLLPSRESVCDSEGEAGNGGTRGARLEEDWLECKLGVGEGDGP